MWYDTYTIIIQLFKDTHRDRAYMHDAQIQQLLQRRILKKSIMTSNYNVQFLTSKDYIRNEIKNLVFNNVQNFDEFVADFYTFLRTDMFTYLFKKSKTQYLDASDFVIDFEAGSINLRYQTVNSTQKEDIKYAGER